MSLVPAFASLPTHGHLYSFVLLLDLVLLSFLLDLPASALVHWGC